MEVDLVVGAVVVVVVVLAGFPTKFRKPFIFPSIASRRRVSDGDTVSRTRKYINSGSELESIIQPLFRGDGISPFPHEEAYILPGNMKFVEKSLYMKTE